MRFGTYLSRSDVKGICFFAILLLLATIGTALWKYGLPPASETAGAIDSLDECRHFFDSTATATQARLSESHPSLFPFDPNTADSATLAQLGIPRTIAGRIVRYRSKGGRFRKATDLAKIYGLPKECYRQLLPYIRIAGSQDTPPIQDNATPPPASNHTPANTARTNNTDKFDRHVALDANKVDSLTLIRIPGIGPYYAHRFLKYRSQLGGYTDIRQLEEIPNFPKDCLDWFYTDHPEIKKIDINHASFKQLLSHPYLNYDQVKAIFNYRHKFGRLNHLQQLGNSDCFTPDDFEKLRPYISF